MNLSHTEHADKRTPKFDLNKVDYEWIAACTNLKELKLAKEELEFDGCFPDLLKVCKEKIASLDPNYKRKMEIENSNSKISHEEE